MVTKNVARKVLRKAGARRPGKRWQQRAAVLGLLCLGPLALVACGTSSKSSSSSGKSSSSSSASTSGTPKQGGNLTIVTSGAAWPSLDPANPVIEPQEALEIPAVQPLFYTANDGSLVPLLAQNYTVSSNSEVITINLRQGINFQDGTPFNAAAVVANLQRYANPSLHSECVGYLSIMKSVTATGPYQVTITLSTPDSGFLPVLGSQQCALMVSPTAVQKEGKNFGNDPVGTGPFKFVSGTTGVVAHYVRWSGYWQKGQPYLNSLTIENVNSDQDALNALKSGTAQAWVNLDDPGAASDVAQAKADANLVVAKSSAPFVNYVTFSFTHPPFNNVLAREAVTYATDTATIVKNLYQGQYQTVQGILPPDNWAYSGSIPGYPTYNLAKAKSLVAQLGGSLSFTLNTLDNPQYLSEAEALQAQWAKAGIHATINQMQTPAWIASLHSLSYQGLLIQNFPYNDPDIAAYRWFLSTSPLTQNGLKSSQVDQIVTAARQTTDQTQRKALYKQFNDLVSAKYVPWDDIMAQPAYAVFSKNVGGFPLYSNAYIPFPNIYLK